MNQFTRVELIATRERAKFFAQGGDDTDNLDWRAAYAALAVAADHLDAMIVREDHGADDVDTATDVGQN